MSNKILVATAGIKSAKNTADYVVQIAKSLGARLVALHIQRGGETEQQAIEALDPFVGSANEHSVPIATQIRAGGVVDCIVESAEDDDVALIVVGSSNGKVVTEWVSADVFDRTAIPVVVLPHQLN